MPKAPPPSIQELLGKREETVEKSAKIGCDARGQFIVRFPREISDVMRLKVGDHLIFKVVIPKEGKVTDDNFSIKVNRDA